MDKFDRIFEIHTLLSSHRRPISLKAIQEKMECSESTARRAIATLKDKIGAPVDYCREDNGYYYNRVEAQVYELPGLWLNAEEIHALLVSYNLLESLQPDLLSEHIQPLKQRIRSILKDNCVDYPELEKRIRIFQQAARPASIDHFRRIADALIRRSKIRVLYHGRERDQTTERIVSPQRLVYYRSNWYLDAWCHSANGLRTFSLDRLQPVETLDDSALDVNETDLDSHFAESYGIFAGAAKQTAVLRFSPDAARWVADEHWHPGQQGHILSDGGYELHIPYGDPRELAMDILKYGEQVEVIAPPGLRSLIKQRLSATLEKYDS